MTAFLLSFGGLAAFVVVVLASLFRTASAPLGLKLAASALAVAAACAAPIGVNALLGYPVGASFEELPEKAELVAFIAHDDSGLVDLWLRSGEEPRAYSTKLDAKMKQTLRKAQERTARGEAAYLVKQGKPERKTAADALAIGGDDGRYVLDPSVVSQLPAKE